MSDDLQRQWIAAAVGGDRAALSQLLLEAYDPLSRHLAQTISPELQAVLRPEDVLQQVFVRAAQHIGSFQGREPAALAGWLRTIADNLVRDALKRRRRERRAGPGSGVPPGGQDSSLAALVDRLAADGTTPGGRASREEHVRRLRAALATLPDEQREVIQRLYLQEQSYDQIAAAMGRTKHAIRGLGYRARQNLRDLLGRSSLYFSR